ncbi:MAG: VOC family protein [Candidatus Acetothermia bacterium]
MSGIVFFQTRDLAKMKDFYLNRIGARVWRDQGDCLILEWKGFNFAFCEREGDPENCGVITFLYDTRAEVDEVYDQVSDIARDEPVSRRPQYDIYQFFAEDPEGRTLEFQTFLDEPKGDCQRR